MAFKSRMGLKGNQVSRAGSDRIGSGQAAFTILSSRARGPDQTPPHPDPIRPERVDLTRENTELIPTKTNRTRVSFHGTPRKNRHNLIPRICRHFHPIIFCVSGTRYRRCHRRSRQPSYEPAASQACPGDPRRRDTKTKGGGDTSREHLSSTRA